MMTKGELREILEDAADITWDFKERYQENAMARAVRYAYPNFLDRVEQTCVGDGATTRFGLPGEVVGLAPRGMQGVPTNVDNSRGLLTAPSTAPTTGTAVGAGWFTGAVYLAYAWSLDTTPPYYNSTVISPYKLQALATNQQPTITIPTFPTYAKSAVIFASVTSGDPDIRFAGTNTVAGVFTLTVIPPIASGLISTPRPLRPYTDIETFDPELTQLGTNIGVLDVPDNPNLAPTSPTLIGPQSVLQLRATTAPALGEAFLCQYFRKAVLPLTEIEYIPIDDDGFLLNAALGYYFSILAAREKEPDVRDQYFNQQKLYLSEAAAQKKIAIPAVEFGTARAVEWDKKA